MTGGCRSDFLPQKATFTAVGNKEQWRISFILSSSATRSNKDSGGQ
uniref:Uncharacterized protein n=1 Tax=Nelumbo nucifera TaxID=4432 RepID=A0A822ZZM1_NELNU|nr:TPA_asm: hypothetical protein HUJ06_018742 [Nelumbo nucifera]